MALWVARVKQTDSTVPTVPTVPERSPPGLGLGRLRRLRLGLWLLATKEQSPEPEATKPEAKLLCGLSLLLYL